VAGKFEIHGHGGISSDPDRRPEPTITAMRSPLQPAERFEITDVHSLAAIVARDPQYPERRRRLARVVAITVGGCALIIVAAGVTHLLRAAPSQTTAPITIAESAPSASAAAAATPSVATADPAPPPPPAATTGTLKLQKPAAAGHAWLDGKKLSQTETTVACGKHKVKVGNWGKTHAVDIPCGGELKVAK
jgi:hypothetical protein